jgi:hypothetical protein
MSNDKIRAERRAVALEDFLAHRKKARIFLYVFIGTPFFVFATIFFLTGMVNGPFDAFAKAAFWPIMFSGMLAMPLSLALGLVQWMRAKNLKDIHRFTKPYES